MARNLPLTFGLALVGAILLDHGAHAFGSVFSSGSSSSGSSVNVSAQVPAGLNAVGQVTPAMLTEVGAAYGWTGSQLSDWASVIKAESQGNPAAVNPSSGAFGIGQFLGATKTKYASVGATSSDPTKQLQAMAQYIHDRYGTPSSAWSHEQSAHWY